MRRAIRMLLAGVVSVAALTGCEKVNSVSSSVSPCFRILPIAHAAVGDQGRFVDVARVRGRVFPRLPLLRPRRAPTPGSSTTIPRPPDSCVVAYRGTFDPSRMHDLLGPSRSGTFAIVIVSVRTESVRATVLTETLPAPLHSH